MLRIAIFLCATMLASAAHAGLIVTLTHDGSNGVVASFSGSGTAGPGHNCSAVSGTTGPCLITEGGTGLGNYVPSVNNTMFTLASSIAFGSGFNILGIYIDDDGSSDDGGLLMDAAVTSAISYSVSGSAAVTGLSFSSLTVGTYTSNNADELDALTYIIRDVSEPAMLGLFGFGLAGLGIAFRGRRTR